MFKWRNDPREPVTFPFTEYPGRLLQMPADFFNIFLTDELLDMMVEKTNNHAVEIMSKECPSWCHARKNRWYDTTWGEMHKFIGLIIQIYKIKGTNMVSIFLNCVNMTGLFCEQVFTVTYRMMMSLSWINPVLLCCIS